MLADSHRFINYSCDQIDSFLTIVLGVNLIDDKNQTKVEGDTLESADADADTLSLESLDSIIAEEDPEFSSSLNEIGHVETNIEIYSEGLALEYSLEDEIKYWQNSSKFRKKLAELFPVLPRFSYKIKIKKTSLHLRWIKWRSQALRNTIKAVPLLLVFIKNFIKSLFDIFKSFSKLKKIGFLLLLVSSGLGGYTIYRISTKGLIPKPSDIFIGSMAEWSKAKYGYNPSSDLEPFYDSTRLIQNILLMKKMVVNIKSSTESGPNPMGAFEFYVEATAPEVLLEIKDRESEVKDIFLRTIEEMTFDQISSGEGKQLLCGNLRKEVNKVLTKGFIKKVFIKTAIVKP